MLIFVGKPTHLAISEVNKKNWTAFFGTYRNAVRSPCLFPVLSNVPCWQKKMNLFNPWHFPRNVNGMLSASKWNEWVMVLSWIS